MANEHTGGFWTSDGDDTMTPEEAAAALGSPQPQVAETYAPEPGYYAPVDETVEALAVEVPVESEIDESPESVQKMMNDARLRLEQGRLYEMLLEHSLFGDLNANPDAIKNVEREIKRFIRERLEVLLGIRPDPRLAPATPARMVGQFNQFEVDVLKSYVRRASNGVSDRFNAPDAPLPVVQPLATGAIRPLGQASAPRQPAPTPRPTAVRVVPKAPPVPVRQPQQPRIAAPTAPAAQAAPPSLTKGGTPTMVVRDDDGSRVVIPAEHEAGLEKAASSMKRSEIAERSKRIAERHLKHRKQVPGPGHMPTIPLEQTNAMTTAYIINRSSMSQGSLANGIPLMPLVNRIIANKSQGE